MRQSPSEKLVSIKRNFYAANAGRTPLDTYLEVIKGIYAAFRLSDVGLPIFYSSGLLANMLVLNSLSSVAVLALVSMWISLTRRSGNAIECPSWLYVWPMPTGLTGRPVSYLL